MTGKMRRKKISHQPPDPSPPCRDKVPPLPGRPPLLGSVQGFEVAFSRVLEALKADEGSLHVTVRRVYLTLLLDELERGLNLNVRHATFESCIEALRLHLDRAEAQGKPPSTWNLRAILHSYGMDGVDRKGKEGDAKLSD